MGTWMNDDGLYIKYGTSEGSSTHRGGEYRDGVSGMRIVEVTLLLASLTQTETIVNDVIKLPENAFICWVETETLVAAATGTAIDVGTIRYDRTTQGDYDGLLAAAPIANMNSAGEVSRYQVAVTIPTGLTGTGALVGTELSSTTCGYISASMTDATAFTAGKIRLRVAYIPAGLDTP